VVAGADHGMDTTRALACQGQEHGRARQSRARSYTVQHRHTTPLQPYAQQHLTAAPHRGGAQLEVDNCPLHLPMPCSMRLSCALGKNMPQCGATQACGAQACLAHGVDPGCPPLRCRPPRHRKQKKQLLESLRQKSLLPRLRNERVTRLLGRLFRLVFRGFC
jgi:hypothetical protein